MEKNKHQGDVATIIAVEAEVLESCENYGVYFQGSETLMLRLNLLMISLNQKTT